MILALIALLLFSFQQPKPFIPVEGASLKAKIDNAVTQGRAGAQGGRFWVGYQFEARPGVAVDITWTPSTVDVVLRARVETSVEIALGDWRTTADLVPGVPVALSPALNS